MGRNHHLNKEESSVSDLYMFFPDPGFSSNNDLDPDCFFMRIRIQVFPPIRIQIWIQVKNTFFQRQLPTKVFWEICFSTRKVDILFNKECFYGRILKNKMKIMKNQHIGFFMAQYSLAGSGSRQRFEYGSTRIWIQETLEHLCGILIANLQLGKMVVYDCRLQQQVPPSMITPRTRSNRRGIFQYNFLYSEMSLRKVCLGAVSSYRYRYLPIKCSLFTFISLIRYRQVPPTPIYPFHF